MLQRILCALAFVDAPIRPACFYFAIFSSRLTLSGRHAHARTSGEWAGLMRDQSTDLEQVSGGYASQDIGAREGAAVTLFRPEALARQNQTQYGSPVALLPPGWSVLALFVALLVAAALIFVSSASYARKETARGILRPVTGEARVMATRGGTLRALLVSEGSLVTQGQTLGFVSTGQALEGGGLADEEVLAALILEEQTLRARLAAFDAGAPLEAAGLQANRAATAAEHAAAIASITTLEGRRILAQGRVAAAETLAERGLIPLEELSRRREALLAIDQALVDGHARVATLRARLAEIDARLSRQGFSALEGRAALESQLANLAQRRAQAEAARGYELRAPVSGRVTGLQAGVGQPLDPQRPLMTITPQGEALVAEIYVPSRAIGFIAAGQPVRLLYDAFPYQRFGPSHGIVQSVSGSVLAPHEVAAAIRLEEPVYRVIVTLDAQSVRAFGTSHAIQSGMALTADIVLEERSFLEWLLEPVLAMRGRL